MKKKIFGGIITVVLITIVTLNVNLNIQKKNDLSLFSLANVEALAQYEYGVNGCVAYCRLDSRYDCTIYVPAPLGSGYISTICSGFRG